MTGHGKDKQQVRIAALPVRRNKKGHLELCLVTSRKRGHWIIPTGKPEKKLSKADVARLEAYEEAGVLGSTCNKKRFCLNARSQKKGYRRHLTLYPMKVRKTLKHWPEEDQRKRCWVSLKKLKKVLSDRTLARQICRKLR